MMLDGDGPGTDAAWTQWKTLHHQTKDLSPWMTEEVRTDHIRASKLVEATGASAGLDEDTRPKSCKCQWRKLAIAAAVIGFVTSLEDSRELELKSFTLLTYLAVLLVS